MIVPIQAIPYLRLVKRLVLGQGSLDAISYQQDILCAEERVAIRPAIYLPGQIERVTDLVAEVATTKAAEITAATSATFTHAPTIAYHIKNAVLFDGTIYVGHFKHPIADKSLYKSGAGSPRQINTSALASSYLGTRYFGHWLADDCTRYLLAEGTSTPLCVRTPPYIHLQQYQDCFGQSCAPTDQAHIDNLIVFQDFSQNSLKKTRYQTLRNKIKARFPEKHSSAYIYLRRGQTGVARIIQNEDEIVDALLKRGFTVVDVSSSNLSDVVRPLLNAKLVVSLEGSHIAHYTVTSSGNNGLLVLEPPDRFSAVHRDWAECLGVRFGFVVGSFCDAGYLFSVPEILATVDLLLNKIENAS
jgi:hypothetical protein